MSSIWLYSMTMHSEKQRILASYAVEGNKSTKVYISTANLQMLAKEFGKRIDC